MFFRKTLCGVLFILYITLLWFVEIYFVWEISQVGTFWSRKFFHMSSLLFKGSRICHPKMYHFGIRIILGCLFVRNNRHWRSSENQVKLTLYRCMSYFLNNSPKTEDEKYAYDIIQKAYWINKWEKDWNAWL